MSVFRCPICAAPLKEEQRSLRCAGGHVFDFASEGYVNLLPVNKKNSLAPGDDRDMVAARRAFLDGGWYAPLREAVEAVAVRYTGQRPMVLDVGCGEGYYTGGVLAALQREEREPCLAAIDISKFAVKKAAKRYKGAAYAVASAYELPIEDNAVDLLLNIFSPLAVEEFHRVMRTGGVFAYVVPGAKHLWEMKELLYEEPYENEEKETPYSGFRYREIIPVDYRLHLPTGDAIRSLFSMTPYSWKTSSQGKERLFAEESLTTTISFRIHVFEKI